MSVVVSSKIRPYTIDVVWTYGRSPLIIERFYNQRRSRMQRYWSYVYIMYTLGPWTSEKRAEREKPPAGPPETPKF